MIHIPPDHEARPEVGSGMQTQRGDWVLFYDVAEVRKNGSVVLKPRSSLWKMPEPPTMDELQAILAEWHQSMTGDVINAVGRVTDHIYKYEGSSIFREVMPRLVETPEGRICAWWIDPKSSGPHWNKHRLVHCRAGKAVHVEFDEYFERNKLEPAMLVGLKDALLLVDKEAKR